MFTAFLYWSHPSPLSPSPQTPLTLTPVLPSPHPSRGPRSSCWCQTAMWRTTSRSSLTPVLPSPQSCPHPSPALTPVPSCPHPNPALTPVPFCPHPSSLLPSPHSSHGPRSSCWCQTAMWRTTSRSSLPPVLPSPLSCPHLSPALTPVPSCPHPNPALTPVPFCPHPSSLLPSPHSSHGPRSSCWCQTAMWRTTSRSSLPPVLPSPLSCPHLSPALTPVPSCPHPNPALTPVPFCPHPSSLLPSPHSSHGPRSSCWCQTVMWRTTSRSSLTPVLPSPQSCPHPNPALTPVPSCPHPSPLLSSPQFSLALTPPLSWSQVQLLVSDSDVENYKQIKSDLDELRLLVEKSELWVYKGKNGGKKEKKEKKKKPVKGDEAKGAGEEGAADGTDTGVSGQGI